MTEPICNLCGCRDFTDINGRAGMRCVDCGSLERTRLLFLYVQNLKLPPAARILHIAPERGLYRYFKARQSPGAYIAADFNHQNYKYVEDCTHIDLCDLAHWPTAQFDLILHSHVLEHCAAPLGPILGHLHRMLRPNGLHMFIIPFAPGPYDEDFGKLSAQERIERFDQADHMRRFGVDDLPQHLGRYLDLPSSFDATRQFEPAELRRYNIPKYLWQGLHGASVLQLGKADYHGDLSVG